jgi:hypothetical protein
VPIMPRRPLVFLFARPWLLLSISLGIAASCTSIYCAMGSLRYEHLAQNERLAAERAERTNIDLQDALDRLRTGLAEMQNGTGEATPEIASIQKMDWIAQLTEALHRLDEHATELKRIKATPRLTAASAGFASGHLQQSWTLIGLDETQKRVEQLSAEYDEIMSERNRLQDRVNELEQNLSLLQASQPSPSQIAKPPPNSSAFGTDPEFGEALPTAARGENPSIVLKNFHSPDWVPDHFNNESGRLFDSPAQPLPRRVSGSKDDSASVRDHPYAGLA